jgi:ubiquitin-conjugating enzyme E2 J2
MSGKGSAEALKRLKRELKRMQKEPTEGLEARPTEKDMLEWHYVVHGPKDSPYEGGVYHGIIKFPPQYPYRPPSIQMVTPNGRFKPKSRLCFSMSDFHPELWNPLWNISSILNGLRSFMIDSHATYGSIITNESAKRKYARESLAFNCKDRTFNTLFPHYHASLEDKRQAESKTISSSSSSAAQPPPSSSSPSSSSASASAANDAGGTAAAAPSLLPLWDGVILVTSIAVIGALLSKLY